MSTIFMKMYLNAFMVLMLFYKACCPLFYDTQGGALVTQHPPVLHPLEARYYSAMDEPQLVNIWFHLDN
jgi:hypothetical protein